MKTKASNQQNQSSEKALANAESLRQKAKSMIEKARKSLSQKRITNTARRSRIAAGMYNDAVYKIKLAKTLILIADTIEKRTTQYLGNLNNVIELITLLDILIESKEKHIKEEGLNHSTYKITEETVNYTFYPFIRIYKDEEKVLLKINDANKKEAVTRLLASLDTSSDGFMFITATSSLEDYKTVFCQKCSEISAHQASIYMEKVQLLKRLQKLNINHDSQLQGALKELINIYTNVEVTFEDKYNF